MNLPRRTFTRRYNEKSHAQLTAPLMHTSPTSPGAAGVVGDAKRRKGSPFWVGRLQRFFCGEVNYVVLGPEAGPLVVCVHGINGSVSTFERLAHDLLRFGFRVLLFDLYGFGASAKPWRALTIDVYVQQLSELIFTAGTPATPVCLIGYSMGGVVAVEFARRYPQWVRRLLLLAPAGLLKKSETYCNGFVFGCLRQALGGLVVAGAQCFGGLCSPCIRRKLLSNPGKFVPDVREPKLFGAYAEQAAERFTWNVSKTLSAYLGAVRHMPLWEDVFEQSYADLAQSTVPVLFIWGDDDCTVPWWEEKEKVKKHFAQRGSSCILLEGAGHGLCIEDAERVAQYAACWFLDSRDPNWYNLIGSWRLLGAFHAD